MEKETGLHSPNPGTRRDLKRRCLTPAPAKQPSSQAPPLPLFTVFLTLASHLPEIPSDIDLGNLVLAAAPSHCASLLGSLPAAFALGSPPTSPWPPQTVDSLLIGRGRLRAGVSHIIALARQIWQITIAEPRRQRQSRTGHRNKRHNVKLHGFDV